jgi:hypothetical protein
VGKQYADELEQLVKRLGRSNTRVFVNWDALSRKYADHIEATMCALGAELVNTRDDAEIAIEGYELPERPAPRSVTVALVDGKLEISGAAKEGGAG